jgi:hypothetical protein
MTCGFMGSTHNASAGNQSVIKFIRSSCMGINGSGNQNTVARNIIATSPRL